MRRKLTKIQDSELDLAIQARYSIEGPQLLMVEFGVGESSIRHRASKLKIPGPQTVVKKLNEQLDSDFFSNWTPQSSYYLGYVVTDGGISFDGHFGGLFLNCWREDEEIVLGFRSVLGSSHKVTHVPAGVDSRGVPYKEKTRIAITNTKLVKALIGTHGILPNKSNLDLPLPFVPQNFFSHFVRGFFDGDGTACITEEGQVYFGLLGSHLMVKQLQEKLSSTLNIPAHKIQNNQRTLSRITWGAKSDVIKIYNWLYPEGEYPFLKRKKDSLQKVLPPFYFGAN